VRDYYFTATMELPELRPASTLKTFAHTVLDQVSLREVVDAAGFYALLPALLLEELGKNKK